MDVQKNVLTSFFIVVSKRNFIERILTFG